MLNLDRDGNPAVGLTPRGPFAALDSMDLNVPPDLLTKPALAAGRGMTPEVLVLEAIERAVEYEDWFLREVDKRLAPCS